MASRPEDGDSPDSKIWLDDIPAIVPAETPSTRDTPAGKLGREPADRHPNRQVRSWVNHGFSFG